MERIYVVGVALFIVVALAACGSHKGAGQVTQLEHSKQTQQAENAARQVAESCLKKGGSVRTMFHCAIPPHHGRQFLLCAFKGAPKSVHNEAAIESDLVTCGEKYR